METSASVAVAVAVAGVAEDVDGGDGYGGMTKTTMIPFLGSEATATTLELPSDAEGYVKQMLELEDKTILIVMMNNVVRFQKDETSQKYEVICQYTSCEDTSPIQAVCSLPVGDESFFAVGLQYLDWFSLKPPPRSRSASSMVEPIRRWPIKLYTNKSVDDLLVFKAKNSSYLIVTLTFHRNVRFFSLPDLSNDEDKEDEDDEQDSEDDNENEELRCFYKVRLENPNFLLRLTKKGDEDTEEEDGAPVVKNKRKFADEFIVTNDGDSLCILSGYGEIYETLEGHTTDVLGAVELEQGSDNNNNRCTILLSYDDLEIRMWDISQLRGLEDFSCIRVIPAPTRGYFSFVVGLNDGRSFAVATQDEAVEFRTEKGDVFFEHQCDESTAILKLLQTSDGSVITGDELGEVTVINYSPR